VAAFRRGLRGEAPFIYVLSAPYKLLEIDHAPSCDTAAMGKLSRTNNPACVLRLIEIGFNTRSKLLARFGLKDSQGTKAAVLDRTLNSLESVGLLEVKKPKRGSKKELAFAVSKDFKTVQGALRLSLKDLANLSQGDHMVVAPLWDPPPARERADVFVMMPFHSKFRRIYKDHIRTTAKKLDLKVERADEHSLSGAIMKDVWESIVTCKVVVAECTERNPNVFYEIGIAHTLGKSVILLTQKKEDIPFDIRHMRYIAYKPTKSGLESLNTQLRSALKEEFASETEAESQE
jgi:hypothetical protein